MGCRFAPLEASGLEASACMLVCSRVWSDSSRETCRIKRLGCAHLRQSAFQKMQSQKLDLANCKTYTYKAKTLDNTQPPNNQRPFLQPSQPCPGGPLRLLSEHRAIPHASHAYLTATYCYRIFFETRGADLKAGFCHVPFRSRQSMASSKPENCGQYSQSKLSGSFILHCCPSTAWNPVGPHIATRGWSNMRPSALVAETSNVPDY